MKRTIILFLASFFVAINTFAQDAPKFGLVVDVDAGNNQRSEPHNFVPFRTQMMFVATIDSEKHLYSYDKGEHADSHGISVPAYTDVKELSAHNDRVFFQGVKDDGVPQMVIYEWGNVQNITDFKSSNSRPKDFCGIDLNHIAFTAWTKDEGHELYLCTYDGEDYSYALWNYLEGKENYKNKELKPSELQVIDNAFHFVGHPEYSQDTYVIYKDTYTGWKTFCEMESITDLTYFDNRYFFRGKKIGDDKYYMYSYDAGLDQLKVIREQYGAVHEYFSHTQSKKYGSQSTIIYNNELYFQIGVGPENGSRNLVKVKPGSYKCEEVDYTSDDNGFWGFVTYNEHLYYAKGDDGHLFRYDGTNCINVADEISDTPEIKFIQSMYPYKNSIYMGAWSNDSKIGTELCKLTIPGVSTSINNQNQQAMVTKLKIYPAPATHYYQCKMSVAGVLEVYNMAGVLMTTEKLNAHEVGTYSTYKYANGIYIAKFIDSNNNIQTTKFTVQK